jgi:hypothetical protein
LVARAKTFPVTNATTPRAPTRFRPTPHDLAHPNNTLPPEQKNLHIPDFPTFRLSDFPTFRLSPSQRDDSYQPMMKSWVNRPPKKQIAP